MPQLDVVTYLSQYVWLTLGVSITISVVTLGVCYSSNLASKISESLGEGSSPQMFTPSSDHLSSKVWKL